MQSDYISNKNDGQERVECPDFDSVGTSVYFKYVFQIRVFEVLHSAGSHKEMTCGH